MGFTKKQDDNMTIWQFDDNTQNAINQNVIAEIVKLPNCHTNFLSDGIRRNGHSRLGSVGKVM